jgi:hypothetical protein
LIEMEGSRFWASIVLVRGVMEYWSFAANCYKAKEQETRLFETKSNSFIIPILHHSVTPISHALDFEHEDEHEDEHDFSVP